MITIHAWQWDTDIPVRIPYAGTTAPELDFMPDTGTGQTVRPALSDGILTAQCPPQLLTSSRPIQIYARLGNTIDRVGTICIKPRPKPPDYVYTESEVWTAEKAVNDAMQEAYDSGRFKGVGVQSIEQTTTSEESEGENIVTVKLTDGTEHPFTVRNGKQGASPVRGKDYWTETDKAEIKSYVDEAILGGAW